ncbi:MAG: protein translocase subunit SecF, partial [Phycisphaerales bacterium]
RIREEIFGGEVELRGAIRLGYQKALSTILDANITNLIICLVLYNTATTEVKGFALTLSIGIIATLITALFVTRVIYEVYTDVAHITRLPMMATVFPAVHRFLEPNINWISLRKVFWSLSIVGVVCSIVLVSVRGVNMFDTEFRGGVAATMQTAVIDDDGDGQPDQTKAGKPVREKLPHTGPDGVETRVRALVGLLDANTPGLDQDTRVRFLNALRARGSDLDEDQITTILREFRTASVLTVGDTTVRNNVIHAESFQIKVANPKGLGEEQTITDVVVAAIVTEFGTQLDVTAPLDFEGAGSANHTRYTFTVEENALGDNIDRPQFSQRVNDFLGGVAVVIENIDPPVSPQDIDKRIDRMRQQEDFARLLGRRVKVFGLDLADPTNPRTGYRSVAVLVYDSSLSSLKVDFDLWDRELAQTEWELISLALQRQTSLEQITTFSPAIAQSLKDKAIVAVGLSLLGILVYIWIRFGSLRYSLAAIVALVHDVAIAMGLLAATAWLGRGVLASTLLIEEFRIDLGVVAALLTIIGYSLNDTIVILDRIRENRGKLPIPTADIVNTSINQTISRTVITSMTTLLAVGIMYGAGGSGIRPFTFCLLIGLVVGTYSSVAIAAPLVFKSESTGPLGSGAKTEATANAEPFTDEPAAATA